MAWEPDVIFGAVVDDVGIWPAFTDDDGRIYDTWIDNHGGLQIDVD